MYYIIKSEIRVALDRKIKKEDKQKTKRKKEKERARGRLIYSDPRLFLIPRPIGRFCTKC